MAMPSAAPGRLHRPGIPTPGFWGIIGAGAALMIAITLAVSRDRPELLAALLATWMLLDSGLQGALMLTASRSIRRARQLPPPSPPTQQEQSSHGPIALTAIIPAWNAGCGLVGTVASLLEQQDAPEVVLVADDGSDDNSINSLISLYGVRFGKDADGQLGRSQIHPALKLLRKPHTGKADSLNQALALTRTPWLMVLDADTRPLPGAISALRRSIAGNPDCSAVGGVLIPICRSTLIGRLLSFFQRREYVGGQAFRLAWGTLDATLLIAGACSAFRRRELAEVGGFSTSSWTEDYEVMFRLHRSARAGGHPLRVHIEPAFQARTEAPASLIGFLRQRRRWAGGLLETLVDHRDMAGNRRFGALGLLSLAWTSFGLLQPFLVLQLSLITALTYGTRYSEALFSLVAWLIAARLLWGLAMTQWALRVYRRSGSGYGSGSVAMALQTLLQPLLYAPLQLIAAGWGYISVTRRQRSW